MLVCDGEGNIPVMDIVDGVNASAKLVDDQTFTGINTFDQPIKVDVIGSTDGNSSVNVASLGSIYGKNRIVNGDFKVWQKGESFVVNGSYPNTADMVNSGTTSGELTITKGTLNGSSIKAEVTVAGSNAVVDNENWFSWMKIESQDVFDLNGKYITLSCTVKTNFSGTLSVNFCNTGVARSYVTDIDVVANIEKVVQKTILLESDTVKVNNTDAGLYVQIGEDCHDDYTTATTDQWVDGSFFRSTNATDWTETLGNTVEISQLQLEEGEAATKFEFVDFATQINRCRRYYRRYTTSAETGANPEAWNYLDSGVGMVWYANNLDVAVVNTSSMRKAPILSYSDIDHFVGVISTGVFLTITSIGFVANGGHGGGYLTVNANESMPIGTIGQVGLEVADSWYAFDATM